MSSFSSATAGANVLGAVIFIAYVLSALFVTSFISYKLLYRYLALSPCYLNQQHGLASIAAHIQSFLILAIFSFSILSYHMLGFLILSYKEWAMKQGLPLPRSVFELDGILGRGSVKLFVWRWLTSSTLFLDFAQEICGSWQRYWWIGQALWGTMGVSVFMASYGRKSRTPRLWAYFLIAQILPISFALNLFYLNLLLKLPGTSASTPPEQQPKTELQPTKSLHINNHFQSRTIFFIIIYASLLILAPLSEHTALFIPIIFAIRFLLLVPALRPLDASVGRNRMLFLLPLVALWIALLLFMMMGEVENGLGVLRAVNENPAVSALGWDYVLCAISIGVWWGTVERGGRTV